MFWKYIEKINWCKVIHHFLRMKYKALDIQITYFGCDAFDINYGWERYTHHAGPRFYITILGVLMGGCICDYRHWNEVEGRFYLDEEPELRWIGCSDGYSETDYWQDIKKTAEVHGLDEDYLARCQAAFMEYKQEKEVRDKQEELEEEKPFVLKHPIDWANVKYARNGDANYLSKKYGIKKVGEDKIEVQEFRLKHILPVEFVITCFDLYDKKGNLISRASDYEDEEYEI